MSHEILIVDDDKSVCDIYREFLQQNGFDVVVETSAKKALRIVRRKLPDLILLDIMLPDMLGFDFYNKVCLLSSGVPFIFITGYGHNRRIARRLEELNTPWLSKPVELVELLNLIRTTLGIKDNSKGNN